MRRAVRLERGGQPLFTMLALLCSVATAQVYQLTTDTFDVALQEGPLFVKFYAPWCARHP